MSGMFAGYNKGSNRGTLTGNWVEEDALRKRTGQSRYESWVPVIHDDDDIEAESESTPYTEIIKKKPEATVERVILHDDAQDPRTYESTNKGASGEICAPSSVLPARVGRRRQDRMKLLYAEAQKIQTDKTLDNQKYQQEQDEQQQSMSRSAYPAYDAQVLMNVPRVAPRGSNSRRVTSQSQQELTRGQREARDAAVLAQMQNVPVSIYSHGLHTGAGLNFAVSSTAGENPFAKFTAFTNDIRDERKVHGEASDPGQDCATSMGPNIHQRSALARIRAFVGENEQTLTRFKDVFCQRGQEGPSLMTLREFETKLRAAGVDGIKSSDIQQVHSVILKS